MSDERIVIIKTATMGPTEMMPWIYHRFVFDRPSPRWKPIKDEGGVPVYVSFPTWAPEADQGDK